VTNYTSRAAIAVLAERQREFAALEPEVSAAQFRQAAPRNAFGTPETKGPGISRVPVITDQRPDQRVAFALISHM